VEARATPDPTTPGRVSIAISVRARGMDGQELTVVLRREGEELARESVAVAHGGARATLHARVDPEHPAAEIAIEGADDAIAADDVRGLLLRPPSGARILVVDGSPPRTGRDDAGFLARAIDLAPDDAGALTRRRVDPETFGATGPSDADVIVLADVPAPPPRVAQQIREHVARGGGLLVAPGERFDARAYEAALGDVLPARARAAVQAEIEGPRDATASPWLVPHGSSGLDQTHTRKRLTLDDIDDGAEVPLVFADGSPALVVGEHEDGRVAIFATTLDDEWTDLPYRPCGCASRRRTVAASRSRPNGWREGSTPSRRRRPVCTACRSRRAIARSTKMRASRS
jgi:hypothetical protein